MYGSRGANGIIYINTKQGDPGPTKIQLNYEYGISTPTNEVEMAKTPQYLSQVDQAYQNSYNKVSDTSSTLQGRNAYLNPMGIPGYTNNLATANNKDYTDEILNNGGYQQVSLNASGGNERTKFYMGGTYRTEEGLLENSQMDRIAARFNITNQSGEKLLLGLRLGLTINDYQLTPSGMYQTGGFGVAQTRALPTYPTYYPSSLDSINPYFSIGNFYFNSYDGSNILLHLNEEQTTYEKQVFRNMASFMLNYKIHPKLEFSSSFGLDYNTTMDRTYLGNFAARSFVEAPTDSVTEQTNPVFEEKDSLVLEPNAEATDRRFQHFMLFGRAGLNYATNFGPQHQLKLHAGAELYSNTVSYNYASLRGFSTNLVQVVSGGTRPLDTAEGATDGYIYTGYYGSANYTFRDKYAVLATFRADASTRFGEEVGFIYYPGLSLSWKIGREDFLKNKTWVDAMALNLSFGKSGNSLLANRAAYGVWNTSLLYNDISNYLGRTPYSISNPMLGAEANYSAEIGLDYSTFSERLNIRLAGFNQITRNTLMYYPNMPSMGIQSDYVPRANGALRNTGVELTLNSLNVKRELANRDFSYSTTLTGTYLSSTITDTEVLTPWADFHSGFDASFFQGRGRCGHLLCS